MANAGDSYAIVLRATHLGWGTFRHTNTRPRIIGEGYLPIPVRYSRRFHIYNSNATGGADILGQNIFHCTSADGLLNVDFKAQGCIREGDPFAKQFSVNNDLRALGTWYRQINAQIGDRIRVTWTSSTNLVVEHID